MYLPDGAVAHRDLRAGLSGGDEVLVHGGIREVAGSCAVGSKEDPVAHGQLMPDAGAFGPGAQDGEFDAGIGLVCQAGSEFGLGPAHVVMVGAGQAREVGGVHGVVVDQDEVTPRRAGEELGKEAADTSETYDSDVHLLEGLLSQVAEDAHLSVVAVGEPMVCCAACGSASWVGAGTGSRRV